MSGNKRIIRSLDLREISAVVRPAQEPALAAIMKSAIIDASDRLEIAAKSAPDAYRDAISLLGKTVADEKLAGHFDEAIRAFCDAIASGSGDIADVVKLFEAAVGPVLSSLDQVAKDAAGPVIVAVTNLAEIAKAQRAATESKAMTDKTVAELNTQIAELTGKLAKAEADLATEKKRADDAVAKADKAEKSATDETITLKGVAFKKSATDPATFAVMKAMAEEIEVAKAEGEADAVFKSMPGDKTMKGAVLRAVNAITDEATRKGALDMLKAGAEAFADLLKTKGTNKPGHESADDSPEAAYDAGLKKYADENKFSNVAKAAPAFHATAEGKKLLKAYNDHAHKMAKGVAA